MLKSVRVFAAVFFMLVLTPASRAGDILFSSLGIREGLSQLTVHAIYQDEKGTIWFGTRQGLNRYNGERIEQININPEPPEMIDHTIWSIYGNNQGSMYILANTTVLRYDLRKETFEPLTPGIADYLYCHDNSIYFVSDGNIYNLDPESGDITLWASLDKRHKPIKQILISKQGGVWLATNSGLVKMNRNGQVEKTFFENEQITSLKEDSRLMLWIGTKRSGAIRFNPHNETNIKFLTDFMDNEVRCFEEDEKSEIWIGTFRGLFRYNPETGTLKHYLPEDNLPNSLSHSSIYSITRDKQGTLWVGSYYGGVNYFNPGKDFFRKYIPSNHHPNHLSYPVIGKMTEDLDGNIWICTEGGGLNRLNRKTGEIRVYSSDGSPGSLAHTNLKYIWYDDKHNRLYIGTHLGGLSVMDIHSGLFTNFRSVPGDPATIPDNVVNRIAPYKDNLLLATQNGIGSILLENNVIFREFPGIAGEDGINDMSIWNIFVDSRERLWIAYYTSELIRFDLRAKELKVFRYNPEVESSYPRFRVIDIFEDRSNHLYFTTDGSGILMYDEDTGTFNSITAEEHGILSNYCFRIQQSPSGCLIITSNLGVSFLDMQTGSVRNLKSMSSLPLSGIVEENGLYVARDGQIFVGGIDGMVSFYESDLEISPASFNIFFSKLYVNNNEVRPDDETGILTSSLSYTDNLVLKHHQSTLVFEFSSSDYLRNNATEYEYLLEGLNHSWIKANSRLINFSHLNPGTYILKVRKANREEDEPLLQAAMSIRIKPAWYFSYPAYIAYVLVLLAFLAGFVMFDRNRTFLKASLDFERREKLRIEELNQSKLRFFTNISHEFRTPLTLIINQVELLTQNATAAQQVMSRAEKIRKHATRLRHLVNELLDFRKQEQGLFKLRVSNNNIVEFLNECYHSFEDFAHSKSVRFVYENPGEPLSVWFDQIQMQKVFYNLLSNAFKFVQPADRVIIKLAPKNNSVVIKIIDSGKGIPAEELNRIFDGFYQAENLTSDSELIMSSGIGLALAKGIIELHGGTITVESTVGEGTTFRVELPLGDSHFTSDQKGSQAKTQPDLLKEQLYYGLEYSDILQTTDSRDDHKPAMLIVEDNEDVMQDLKEIFSPGYRVFTAGNGQEGLEKTLQILPDIVLSDVMMASMSGLAMCRKIKQHYELSHIPVVLLTSQNMPEQISDGYLQGADDYITKPFDVKVLVTRCNNLVKGRKLLRDKFSRMITPNQTIPASHPSDHDLLRRINEVTDLNLDNSEFNIDLLAKELGISRSKLYAAVKDISGITPNTYILNYKMQKAAEWLHTTTELNISEIAFNLGFNTPRYFSRCFRDHFGISPNEFRKRRKS